MIKQILIAIDQLLNTLAFWMPGGCWADETLSARAWRTRGESTAWLWIDTLFFWQSNHCENSYRAERERRQLPPEYR